MNELESPQNLMKCFGIFLCRGRGKRGDTFYFWRDVFYEYEDEWMVALRVGAMIDVGIFFTPEAAFTDCASWRDSYLEARAEQKGQSLEAEKWQRLGLPNEAKILKAPKVRSLTKVATVAEDFVRDDTLGSWVS